MSALPSLATRDRVTDAVLVVFYGIVQASALAAATFATRDAFAALHAGTAMRLQTMTVLAVAGVVAALCFWMSRRRAEALGQNYANSLRRALYRKIARLPKSRHDQRRVGALSLRFVGDLSAARLWFGRGLPDLLTSTNALPGAVAILLALDPLLAMAGLVPLVLALMLAGVSAWHLHRRHRKLRRRRAGIAIRMIERIAVAPELDLMGRTGKELRVLDEQGIALRDDAVARRGRTSGLQALLQIGVAAAGLCMLWTAGQHGIAPAVVAASLSVLALVAMPLRDLGAAWDSYCAWRVAREKAKRLLAEPSVVRKPVLASGPVSISVQGKLSGRPVSFSAASGRVTKLRAPNSIELARCISGLDACDEVQVTYNDQRDRPRMAHVGDDHVGLQGSLRRSVTLMSRKRPGDAYIAEVLEAFGLVGLLLAPGGLDQRLSENGRGLTSEESLRLDLARVVLGKVDLIVIASLRWSAEPCRQDLLHVLRGLSPATIILAEPSKTPNPSQYTEVQ